MCVYVYLPCMYMYVKVVKVYRTLNCLRVLNPCTL